MEFLLQPLYRNKYFKKQNESRISVNQALRTEQYDSLRSTDQSTVAFKQMFGRAVSDTADLSPPFQSQPVEVGKLGMGFWFPFISILYVSPSFLQPQANSPTMRPIPLYTRDFVYFSKSIVVSDALVVTVIEIVSYIYWVASLQTTTPKFVLTRWLRYSPFRCFLEKRCNQTLVRRPLYLQKPR
jgi:hypothetical protein